VLVCCAWSRNSGDAGDVADAAGFMIATALLRLAGISPGFVIRKADEH
jgi:hypothetical protein